MRVSPELERGRSRSGIFTSTTGDLFGFFEIDGPCAAVLRIISCPAEHGEGWDHVSVSTRTRCPNWKEMCYVKDLFWDEEETVLQLHPPKSRWVNNHPFCLHLWKPAGIEIPIPPEIAVGRKEMGDITEMPPEKKLRLIIDAARTGLG